MKRIIEVWLSLVLSATPALAQTGSTGALQGTISDPTGALVPQAEVRVTSVSTGESRTVHTQPDGAFVVPLLAPGEYVVDVTMSGFQPATRKVRDGCGDHHAANSTRA
jgi:hypothetical protein